MTCILTIAAVGVSLLIAGFIVACFAPEIERFIVRRRK